MALDDSQLPTLKTEIALPAYAGLDESATAEALNARNIAADVDVTIEAINRRLIGQGILGAIDARIAFLTAKVGAAVSVGGAEEVRLANLHTARRSLELLPTYEMSNSQTRTFVSNMLASLVTEGVMSGAQRTALLALASGFISRAEQLFGRGTRVDSGDVSRAKKV